MKTYLKIELNKAFRNKLMYIVIIIGCMLSIADVVLMVLPKLKYVNPQSTAIFPHTVWDSYMGLEPASMLTVYFYTYIPLLATIPYAVTAYTDKKNGVIKNIFVRTNKRTYYISKYIVSFITGGAICIIPQILNLLIVAILLPSMKPDPYMGFIGVTSSNMWAEVFYSHPYTYVFIYLIFDFIAYGLLNTVAVTAIWIFNNKFVILLIPCLFGESIVFITHLFKLDYMSPMSFLEPVQPLSSKNTYIGVCIYISILLLIAILGCIWGSKKKNIY